MENYFISYQKPRKNLSYFRMALFFALLLGSIFSVTNAAQNAGKTILLGVLHVNSPTGASFLKGVEAAKNDFGDINVKVVPLPYTDSTHGIDLLTHTVINEKVQILIGPTESDVFIRALEKRSELEKRSIPIISSLVSADIPHVRSGWFFLTNVDVRRRVQTTYDFLNKYWVRSITILHANTEFGRRAEQAFSAELSANQRENYLSLNYSLPAINARPHVRKILDQRPEAVGIFGEREDIEQTMQMLNNMNKDAIAYDPIIFTVIDARRLKYNAEGLYFVSVTNDNKKVPKQEAMIDDVMSLAYIRIII